MQKRDLDERIRGLNVIRVLKGNHGSFGCSWPMAISGSPHHELVY
jgi:hypothetical protein